MPNKIIKNFNNIALVDYPLNVLKGFSIRVKEELAERAVKTQDYAGLENIIKVIDYLGNILNEAVERLDVKAVKLIVEAKSKGSYYQIGSSISDNMIRELFAEKLIQEFDESIANEKRIEILRILLNAKDKDKISLLDLQKLADVVPQQEFEEFCKAKELDLSVAKFKNLELSVYKFAQLDPVLSLENNEKTILNLLLSRTFSDKLTLDELKKVYTKLYELSSISKEMLTYTAALISQGNSIKILFAQGTSSFYSKEQNIIKIDNMFIGENIFNTESVLIHEIGHFVYHQIFKMDATPFNFLLLKNIIQDFYQEHKETLEDPFMKKTFNYELKQDKTLVSSLVNSLEEQIIGPILSYEAKARIPVDKAAELLLVESGEYAKYMFTQEYTEYFKTHSYIDLFYLNSLAGFQTDKKTSCNTTMPDHVFDNILKIYLAQQDACPNDPFSTESYLNNNPFAIEPTREGIVKWAEEEFLATLVKELNLSPTQIHFLDRIADYINRGDHLLDNKYIYNYHYHEEIDVDNEKYAELIVRCSEFKAAGLEKDLSDTCQGLDSYHIEHVSPSICAIIQTTEVAAMPFDAGMIGENYTCLSND